MERRSLLAAVGAVGLTLAAGCTDGGSSEAEVAAPSADADDGPERVVEAWNELLYGGAGSITQQGPTLVHSESPLADELQFFAQQEQGDRRLDSSELSVVDRDLDVDAVEERLVQEAEAAQLAAIDGENAVVEAELSFTGDDAPSAPITERWLTAIDGDEWRIVTLVT